MPVGRTVTRGRPVNAAGQRDKYVQILAVDDPTAQFPQFEALASVWMSSRGLTADERFTSDQESAFAQTQWTMPYREDMDPDLVDVPAARRLVYQGREYDILTATPIGRQQSIELITRARVG